MKRRPFEMWWYWAGLGLAACTLTRENFVPEQVGSGEPSTAGNRPLAPAPPRTCDAACSSPSSVGPAPAAAPPPGETPESPPSVPEAPAPPASLTPPAPPSGAAGEDAPDGGAFPAVADATPDTAAEPPDVALEIELVGWASVAGLGTGTTTGGAAGATVRARTPEELAAFASSPDPLTIELEGTLRLGRVDVASHKTLRGVGSSPRLEGGLRIRGTQQAFVRNVIVQNLSIDASFSEVEGDGVQIHHAHHVWVDHCDVRDAPDGNVDIVHGSDFVTVSWSRFSFDAEAPGARQSALIGHSDNGAAEDTGHLRVTWHHNLWAEGILGSMPRVRFGDVHLFNNHYAAAGADAAITASLGARLLVEHNFFEALAVPYRLEAIPAPAPQLRETGNLYARAPEALESSGDAFIPPYAYEPDAASDVPALVGSGAGPTLPFAASSP